MWEQGCVNSSSGSRATYHVLWSRGLHSFTHEYRHRKFHTFHSRRPRPASTSSEIFRESKHEYERRDNISAVRTRHFTIATFLCNKELRNPLFSCIEMTLGDHNRPLFSFVDLHILVFATSSWKRSEQRSNELALIQDSQLRAVIVTVSTERGTS